MGFFDKLFNLTWLRRKTTETQNLESAQPTITCNEIKRGIVSTSMIELNNYTVENLRRRYIAIDVETTGLDSNQDRIIEVGAVLFENGQITKRYESLVNAEVVIPSAATAINHITNDMIKNAPKEEEVYLNLVDFLNDALNGEIALCAHNARFDMGFLSQTLMRLGYNGQIYFVDTLDLSRKLVKNLLNYKQDTVADYFGIVNEQVHRASSDAEACGKILWSLLDINDKEQEKRQQYIKRSRPSDEEREVCAYIQDIIVKNGGDTEWLGFAKNSSNYVEVKYLYSILKFKFAKKGKYIIIKTKDMKNLNFYSEPCTLSEGGVEYSRVYFDNPFELESLSGYIFKSYKKCRKSALDYFRHHKRYEAEARNRVDMMNALTSVEVESLLLEAKKRQNSMDHLNDRINQTLKSGENFVTRSEIKINPIHNRVQLNAIRNLDDSRRGFDEGYQYWEQGEKLRKVGDIESAISLFDQARYNGYDATVLFESYAKAYHKLKDYDNEIDILDEGIKRKKKDRISIGKLETRRNKAIQLLHKKQEAQKKMLKKQQKIQEKKVNTEVPKRPKGRAVLQLSTDMSVIKKYETIAQAVRETGINSKSISDTAKGIQKHAGGYVWKYVDEDSSL